MKSVSIITPTVRRGYLDRLSEMIQAQTYPNIIEHILIEGAGTIGEKRNEGCRIAKGEIIVHFDDDDLYSPDYIQKCVDRLKDCDITGVSQVYFFDIIKRELELYRYRGGQSYVIESGMAYYSRVWRQKRFKDIRVGEGNEFQAGRKVNPIDGLNDIIAIIHGGNTSSHLNRHQRAKVPLSAIQNLSIFVHIAAGV